VSREGQVGNQNLEKVKSWEPRLGKNILSKFPQNGSLGIRITILLKSGHKKCMFFWLRSAKNAIIILAHAKPKICKFLLKRDSQFKAELARLEQRHSSI
jgi:hypothetical protein